MPVKVCLIDGVCIGERVNEWPSLARLIDASAVGLSRRDTPPHLTKGPEPPRRSKSRDVVTAVRLPCGLCRGVSAYETIDGTDRLFS